MSNRGRPRTADILTPREYEVLALLRDGLSNREIAERLGISLAGAKYHVSEIIGKLGVGSREEAARWMPGSTKRWSFAPLSIVSPWREGLPAWLTPKLATVATGMLVAIGLAAGVVILNGGEEEADTGPVLAAVEPTPTPLPDPCEEQGQQEGCIGFRAMKLYFASVEEAAEVTSFVPLLPEVLPAGYERTTLGYMWPGEIRDDLKDSFDSKGPRAPFEGLYAEYADSAGNHLLINQGYSIGVEGLYEAAPDEFRGTVNTGNREARWVRGFHQYEYTTDEQGHRTGWPIEGAWDDTGRLIIYWEIHRPAKGKAWEIAPDGTRTEFGLGGQPFVYAIIGESLDLETLLEIASSVPQ